MKQYRAYVIGNEGRFIKVHELECRDDDEAKTQALQFVNGHDVELWEGARLLGRLGRNDVARR